MEQAIRQFAERYKLKSDYQGDVLDEYFRALEVGIDSIQMQIKLRKIISAVEKTYAPGDYLSKAAVLEMLKGVYIGDQYGEKDTGIL